jgi:hypothetical protein
LPQNFSQQVTFRASRSVTFGPGTSTAYGLSFHLKPKGSSSRFSLDERLERKDDGMAKRFTATAKDHPLMQLKAKPPAPLKPKAKKSKPKPPRKRPTRKASNG